MRKKFKMLALTIIPIIAVLFGVISFQFGALTKVYSFSLNDYSGHMDAYIGTCARSYGTIETAQEARNVAENILNEESENIISTYNIKHSYCSYYCFPSSLKLHSKIHSGPLKSGLYIVTSCMVAEVIIISKNIPVQII